MIDLEHARQEPLTAAIATVLLIASMGAGCVRNGSKAEEEIRSAANVVRQMLQRQEPNEHRVAKATCKLLRAGIIANTSGQNEIENDLYGELGIKQGSPEGFAVSPLISRAASALYVGQQNGGAARYYAQYCAI